MNNYWINTPFVHRFVNLTNDKVQMVIPFAIGGATQQGTEHALDNLNNQDAISISIAEDFLIVTVCDGCSSTHDTLRDSLSNNEVGAKLIAFTTTKTIQTLIGTNDITDSNHFVQTLSQKLTDKLVSIINLLADTNEKDKEIFIFDFLMTTILGLVVTKDYYLVFGCGNGIIGVNNEIRVLEDTGSYFAASILPKCCPSRYSKITESNNLSVLAYGSSSDLTSIFLATDGFNDIVQNFCQELTDFIKQVTPKSKCGFDFLLPAFRKYILGNNRVDEYSITSKWPKDDASFVLLRRMDSYNPDTLTLVNQTLVKEFQNDSNRP